MTRSRPILIGEKWEYTDVAEPINNPYDGSLVAHVCQAGPKELTEALDCACRAFTALKTFPGHMKAKGLGRIATTIEQRREEFARTICSEAGKPINDARREVDRGVQTFRIASEETTRIPGEVVPMDRTPGMEKYHGIVRRFPIGPVLGITPFNFPLNLVAHKVAPCLAVGNPIVIKPPPQTPLTSLLLGEVILESGFPPGTLSVIPCSNSLAESLVQDTRFQALSFTGSASVGWMLKTKAGKKRVLLELGGNAGVVIEPDAQIDTAVHRCIAGGFGYSGQVCISVQRILVQESVYEPFLENLIDKVRHLPTGDPGKEETVVGPLINQAAVERLKEWLDEAVSQGAKIRTGGTFRKSVMAPTVLTDVRPHMKVSCEEVFGPVVTVSPYGKFEEALHQLNDSAFGLQIGIFTQDINKIFRAYHELEVGAVLANEIPTFRADHLPYGGVKDSGLGREGIRYAIQEMTDLKLLVINSSL